MDMEGVLSNRDQEIDELTSFTAETRKELNEIVTKLGWNEENSTLSETPLICPFNSSHRLPPKSFEKHIENCLWKAEGYSEDSLPLSIPSVPPDAPTCIKLDEQTIENILQSSKQQDSSSARGACRLIPRTSDRLLTDFTPEERRIIYDYVISHTEQPDIGEDIADLNKTQNNDNKTSSYLELLAQERNLKRRRAKHRGVHTNKKSQTEIMREVINQQMEMLSEYLGDKDQSNKIELNSEELRNGFVNKQDGNSKEFSRDSRRESSRDCHQYSSRKESIEHSKHSKSSRHRDSRERRSPRDSEERKKHKKHEKNRSKERDYDHHRHRSNSRKKSRSRDDEKCKRRRRRSPN